MLKLFRLIFIFMMIINSFAQASSIANTASTLLMVPPVGFRYNPETAVSNKYQHSVTDANVNHLVMNEFNNMVQTLKEQGINVLVFDNNHDLPDAVFPNNWFSTHVDASGKTDIIVYPMLTKNRQAEVKPQALNQFLQESKIATGKVIDLRKEHAGVLEGTGSMILDRKNHLIYASLSERTTQAMVDKAAGLLHYRPIVFNSSDDNGHPIYHTNVMMGIGEHFAVICLECIHSPSERQKVEQELTHSGKKIINISQDQIKHMCGNVLEVNNSSNHPNLIMSQQAYDHFTEQQKNIMSQYDHLLPVAIPTIEKIGGGSARCMMAEIYK